ncbi:MAG: hypothetical protein OEU48_08495 [Gammaproteobacteria bacterium]|nr:hypothetical protein [Gammaproteobacteria bacterium]
MNLGIEETDKADACTTGISNIIIAIFAYLFLVVPVVAFTIATAMNLSASHGIAIAVALVITGLYIFEKTACLDR